MDHGDAELEHIVARIRAIPGLARRAAADASDAVKDELERTIRAGTTPEGETWAPKKRGSGQPLEDAAEALAVAPVGTRIFMRLKGHIARHHLGRAKGGVYRRIIPTEGIPPNLARAITKVLGEHFNRVTKGSG